MEEPEVIDEENAAPLPPEKTEEPVINGTTGTEEDTEHS
jgi:hypothetical protein